VRPRAFVLQIIAITVWLAAGGGIAIAQPDSGSLRPFHAVYGLFDGDKRVGRAEFTLRYDRSATRWVYESRSEFDGFLLRLAAPHPVVEHSEFELDQGRIRPLSYTYQDGTRRGRRNLELDFDGPARQVTVTRDEESFELPAPPEPLDRASVRLALGMAVRDGRRNGHHDVADPDVFHTYEFSRDGSERIATPVGELDVYRVRQWRAGSSREMNLWIAPALGFHAARIEQRRPDRDPVAFMLEAFEWLAADGSAIGLSVP
jgi:hypothetical protein